MTAKRLSKPLADRYCSGCKVSILEPFDIARHNQECAETGERSYPQHESYRSRQQRFGSITEDAAAAVKARLVRNGIAPDQAPNPNVQREHVMKSAKSGKSLAHLSFYGRAGGRR